MVTARRDIDPLALAPSATEQEKAVRTHNMIRGHLETDDSLKKYKVDTYLQGSYKNSTNVRGDSDVDMGCRTREVFLHDVRNLPDTPTVTNYGTTKSLRQQVLESFSDGAFTYYDYRLDVYKSLANEYANVRNCDKCINVPGNTYRLDADVLPCVAFRQYYESYSRTAAYHEGIAFLTSSGKRIVNFPEQHYQNLADKDQRKNGKVKGVIRITKRLRNELEDRGQWDRKRSPSFYLESLIWNAPDDRFDGGYATVLQNVLAFLYVDMRDKKSKGRERDYMQANNIFVLFHEEFWNIDDAIAFVELIWNAAFITT